MNRPVSRGGLYDKKIVDEMPEIDIGLGINKYLLMYKKINNLQKVDITDKKLQDFFVTISEEHKKNKSNNSITIRTYSDVSSLKYVFILDNQKIMTSNDFVTLLEWANSDRKYDSGIIISI